MREAYVQQLQGTARQVEVPVPSGGLNTRENRASMPILDAVQFQNMISEPDGVKSRRGYESFGTGMTGTVNHISDFYAGSTRKMVVGAGTVLYSVPTGGGTATSVKTGFTNTDFLSAQIGGNMALVNGADTPQIYDGSTSTDAVYSGDLNTDGPSNVDGINVHKNRMYVWDTATSNFYYGATDAIQGAFTKFPLGNVSKTGGNLLMMHTISRDGGAGPDDYAAFILDTGEVLIYEGSDPGSASAWSIIGRFYIPTPINKRSGVEYAGDVVVLTTQDIVFLSEVMRTGNESGGVLLSPSKLAGAIREAYQTYGSNTDWSLTVFNNRGWLVVNVPEVDDSNYFQLIYVMSTKAPACFKGWNGTSYGAFNSGLFFGGSGVVYQAYSGFDDDGSNISCKIQQAFSTLQNGQQKIANDLNITFLFDGSVSIGAEVIYDYEERQVSNTATSSAIGATWDTADWDTAEWAGLTQSRQLNFTPAGSGIAMSTIVQFDVSGSQFVWLSTRISFDILTMI